MKQFLKYVLATIVGIACISVFTLVLSFIVMGVIAASSDSKPTIKDGTVLRISLSGSITERSNDNPFANLESRKVCAVREFVSSGSGNAKGGSNICHVHHQGQFFQRVILFLVHLASFLPFWESKLVFEWPKRITQSKFFILFSSRRMVGGRGVCVAQTCTDAQSARKTAHVGTTRPTPRSE